MFSSLRIKDHFKENKIYLNRTVSATIFVGLCFLVLIGRLIFLQVYQHDTYLTLARNNQVRVIPIPPPRGLIYDRNGVLLAENLPAFSLEIQPNRVKNLSLLIDNLRSIIELTDDDIKEFQKQIKYKGIYETIPIKSKLSEKEVADFSVEKHNYPEVEIVGKLARNYPHGAILAHSLGYIGPISEVDLQSIDITNYRGIYQTGKSGIEKTYEDHLRGQVGYENVETDVRGRILRTLDVTPPIPGSNLQLSIDYKLQKKAYELLKGRLGAIVMLDVDTGDILSLASSPSYDPNLFIQGISNKLYTKLQNHPEQPLFNRAINGQYPPGSTVKPMVALKAIDKGLISNRDKFFDPGYYQIDDEGRLFRDWKKKGHGVINLERALAESCSTFFYYLGDKMGINDIHSIFSEFGLGSKTQIDIPGESTGLAPSVDWKRKNKNSSWFTGETLITAIGQGYVLATPLQVSQAASIFAKRGTYVKPRLVTTITKANNTQQEVPVIEQEQVNIKNKNAWNVVIKGMEMSIKDHRGTAHRIYNPNQPIAGKTGTAQVFGLKQDEEYVSEDLEEYLRDHGWFMAFSPISKPKVAIAVILEHNKGSTVVAKKMIDEYFKGNNDDQ